MGAGDIQSINAQTPGVERAHQNRPQQPEAEQRQFQNIQENDHEAKLAQARESEEAREAQIQLAEEQERKRDRSRKQKTEHEEEDKENLHGLPRGRNLSSGRNLDIVV